MASWRFMLLIAACSSLPLFSISLHSVASAQQVERDLTAEDSPSHVRTLENRIASAIEKAAPSVVAIVRGKPIEKDEDEREGTGKIVPYSIHEYGTGIVVESSLILTNYHLLGDVNDRIGILRNGRFWPAKILAADPWTDLAILKASDLEQPAIEIANVTQSGDQALRQGQFAVEIGNPYKMARAVESERGSNIDSAFGTIASVSYRMQSKNQTASTIYRHGGLIKMDRRIRLGSSGGAVVDLDGRLIAIVTSIASLDGYDTESTCAVPMTEPIRRVVETLSKGELPKFGFLGIDPVEVPLAARNAGELIPKPVGVRAERIIQGTPAAKSGLLAGDVIAQIDGQSLTSLDDLLFRIGVAATGSTVRLQVRRRDPILRRTREIDREVVLSKRFVETTRTAIQSTETFQWRGITVDYFTAVASRDQLLSAAPKQCVRVTHVADGSPAWDLGIRRHDLIVRIAGQLIETPEQFRIIAEANGLDDQPVKLEFARHGTVVVEAAEAVGEAEEQGLTTE